MRKPTHPHHRHSPGTYTGTLTPNQRILWAAREIEAQLQNLKEAIGEKTETESENETQRIIATVCRVLCISPVDMLSRDRSANISQARSLAIYILHIDAGEPMKQVARTFGLDHSGAWHAVRRVRDQLSVNAREHDRYQQCLAAIWPAPEQTKDHSKN